MMSKIKEDRAKPLDDGLKTEKITREEFLRMCSETQGGHGRSNEKFLELFDLIVNQRFQKEEEYRKRVSLHK